MKHGHLAVAFGILTAAALTMSACAKAENGKATPLPSSTVETEANPRLVDDAWFGVRPDGGKVTPESSGADISVNLYPEPNLKGGIQGTAGPGIA